MILEDLTYQNINDPDDEGVYPIHKVCSNCYGFTTKMSDLEKVISLGANVELKSHGGQTPLHVACANGKYSYVKKLLQSNVFIDAIDNDGRTPIHKSVIGSNNSILILAEAGAIIEAKDCNGMTPLHMACVNGKVGAIKNLCDIGANTKIVNNSGVGLVGLCLKSFSSHSHTNCKQMLRSLLKNGAPVGCIETDTGNNELHQVTKVNNKILSSKKTLESMRILIKYGANPWQRNNSSLSAIDYIKPRELPLIKSALKKCIKGNELAIVVSIISEIELQAFFFNQERYSKGEVYELLKEGTAAKNFFEETLKLPPIQIDK